jgi:hypothetical protein
MRRNRKRDVVNEQIDNPEQLSAELILLSKRHAETRSDRRRSHGKGGYPALGCFPEPLPTVGAQLITQLADLDLSTDIRMTDSVSISVELPLWQVMELSGFGDFNHNLVSLLDATLDGRPGEPAYLTRLNAIILREAQNNGTD